MKHQFQLPKSVLWFGDKSVLLAQGAVLSASPAIDCSLLGFTAALICPLTVFYWKVAIAVYVNVIVLGNRLKNMVVSVLCLFGRVVLAYFLEWVDSALQVSRLGPEWFRLWAGFVQFQYGELENDGVWYKDRVGYGRVKVW